MSLAEPAAVPDDPSPLRRDLFAITADGAAFSVMVGAAQTYLPAFVLALGHGEVASALVATVPMVAGGLLQLAAPPWIARLGSQKRWVILISFVQVLSLLPLAWGAAKGTMPVAAVFAAATVYWAAGIGAAPAWTSWVSTLVPGRIRSRFFGVRQAVCQGAVFIALVGAGAWLYENETGGSAAAPFVLLFGLGAAARTVSCAFLTIQSEPEPLPRGMEHVPLRGVVSRLRAGGPLRAVFCALPAMAAMQVAHPFFTAYALDHLRVGYDGFLWLLAAEFLGRIVALPALGVAARRWGSRRVLLGGAVGLVPVAALWAASDALPWLIGVQFLAGIGWAAFELGGFLVFFDAVEEHERTSVLTTHFFAYTCAIAGGSLVGGLVLDAVGRGAPGYAVLFAVSTLARFAALRLLAPLRAPAVAAAP